MAPELAPFMADECLLSMPEVEGIDYTMKEYIKLVEKTKECVERLNAQGKESMRRNLVSPNQQHPLPDVLTWAEI